MFSSIKSEARKLRRNWLRANQVYLENKRDIIKSEVGKLETMSSST